MNRKDYRKPTMKVVRLQHTGMLMTSEPVSGKSASMNVTYEEETWDE
jgi:hypothetical protein